MGNIFSETFPIVLIAVLGSLIKRKWLTSEEFWRGMEKLSYFLLFPCLLFNDVSGADLKALSSGRLVSSLVFSSCAVGGALIWYAEKYSFDRIKFTSLFQGSIRYNNYVFFAFGNALFGSEGLIVISVISAYMIVFTNIVSVAIFAFYSTDEPSEEKSGKFGTHVKSLAANPLIIASLGGMLFNYAHIEIGAAAKNTLTTLSGAALSIGMLNVGAGLRFDISGQDFKLVVYSGLIKLFVFPIVTWIFLFLFSVTGIERSVGLLYACLPCASTSYALSRQLGGHPDSMASIITFTTVFSVISLSFLMYIL